MGSSLLRGVGYCQTPTCAEYLKGTFILGGPHNGVCTRCLSGHEDYERMYVEMERWERELPFVQIFTQVSVHYDFVPQKRLYQLTAVVRDTSLTGGITNTYQLWSPLIKTDKRALGVAESLLANLNYGLIREGEEMFNRERVLNLDEPREEFFQNLASLSKGWMESPLNRALAAQR